MMAGGDAAGVPRRGAARLAARERP